MKPIYIADDNIDTLQLVDSILSNEGYHVKCFNNWQGLLNQLNYYDPALIMLDVYLGPADGRDIAKQLKRNMDTMHIPILLFSSHKEAGNSIVDFLAKPFTATSLLYYVKRIIGPAKN